MERKREEEKNRVMKSKKIIDELLKVLENTESDLPCEEFFDIWEEQEKCANECKFDHPMKKCWLRWAKMKITEEKK